MTDPDSFGYAGDPPGEWYDQDHEINEEVYLALVEFVAWLDESLNGVRGEVEELKTGQERQEVVEQLEWKTENMMEEAKQVAKEISRDLTNKDSE